MSAYLIATVLTLSLFSQFSLGSEIDQVRARSLVCESGKSYNETIIVELKNKLAAIRGTEETPYPTDCRFLPNKPLPASFVEYSGGAAIVTAGDTTFYTNKSNVVLGKKATAQEKARDQCLKNVLGRFCLGGSTSDLPDPDSKTVNSYVYLNGGERTLVKSIDGRVATVSIFYPKPSWLNYRLLLGQLKKKYGAGTNFDTFPEYASSDSSRETAISLGKGRAMTLWTQTGWSIKYGWASDKWRILEYQHNDLSDMLRERNSNRL